MADKLKQVVNKYICRKEREGPITMSDRRRARNLREGPSQTPVVPVQPVSSLGSQRRQSSGSRGTPARSVSRGKSSSTRPDSDTETEGEDDEVQEEDLESDHDDDDEDDEEEEEVIPIPRVSQRVGWKEAVLMRNKSGRIRSETEGVSGSQRKGKGGCWIIRGPVPGGPEDPSVIPSFGGHVASTISWGSVVKSRSVLVGYNRPAKVADLGRMPLYDDVRAILEASGLCQLHDCTFDHVNMNLISAFIERWQPDTNTLHMPFGEMSILLHDVHYLLGLPIVGKMCAPPLDEFGRPVDGLAEVCGLFAMSETELTGLFDGTASKIYKNGGVLAEAVKKVVEGGDVEDQGKAYIALLVGSTLFVDKSTDRIRPHIFPLLTDLDSVGDYAWGAGALAYLYRQLGQASRAGAKGIAGCLPLLEAWIYHYFPCFRPGPPAPVGRGQPGIVAWRGGPKHIADGAELQRYREMIDALTCDSVRWVPVRSPDRLYPTSLFSGCIRFMEVVEPYQPDRCMRQYGYVQCIPQPMLEGDFFRPAKGGYRVDLGPYAGNTWNNIVDHRVRLAERSELAVDPGSVAEGYYEWYCRVSHRLICDPGEVQQRNMDADVNFGANIGITLARTVRPMLSMRTLPEVGIYLREHGAQLERLCDLLEGQEAQEHGGQSRASGRGSRGSRASGRGGRGGRGDSLATPSYH